MEAEAGNTTEDGGVVHHDPWAMEHFSPAIDDPSSPLLKHVAHVTLADLADAKEPTVTKFSRSMRICGFSCVKLPADILASFEDCYRVAESFLSQTQEEKDRWAMKPGSDVGYMNMEPIKEYYQMRYSTSDTPWPTSPPDFKAMYDPIDSYPFLRTPSSYDVYFHTMRSITRASLINLARGIETDPAHFLDLLDSDERLEEKDFLSSTIYRFFRYKNLGEHQDKEPCMTHTDIGVLTVIPRTNVSQLLMLHPETMDWIKVEALCGKDEALIFCGETLERLTLYHYRAVIHRVEPSPLGKKRYSLVWLCRGRPDAVLDSVALESKVLGPVYYEYRAPISVSDFMRKTYSSKLSANGLNTNKADEVGFPGANITDDKSFSDDKPV